MHRARPAQHAVRARRPRSPTAPARIMQTPARRLHTRANAQRTRRTRLHVGRRIGAEKFTAQSPRARTTASDGLRSSACSSLPLPSPDTHGRRARVAFSSIVEGRDSRRAWAGGLAVQRGVGQVLGSGGPPLGHATRLAGRHPDASSKLRLRLPRCPPIDRAHTLPHSYSTLYTQTSFWGAMLYYAMVLCYAMLSLTTY